jgi:hypothetical protein
MTHLIKISKYNRDIVAAVAAECCVPARFYTIENNDELLLVELKTCFPEQIWYLGIHVGMEIAGKIFQPAK